MPKSERTRTVRIELDGIVGLGELEEAALAFGRSAPAQLVADAIESMVGDLVDAVVGPFGLPLPDTEQLEAPWACTGCASPSGVPPSGVPTEAPQGGDGLRAGGVPLPAAGVLDVFAALRPRS